MHTIKNIARWTLWPLIFGASLLAYAGLSEHLAPGLALFAVTVGNLVGIALLELWLPARREWSLLRDRQFPRDIAHALLATEGGGRIARLLLTTGATLLAAALAGAGLTSVVWPTHWPLIAQCALGLVILETVFYVQHRWFHRGWQWRFHALHHNADRMHVLKSGRLHIVEIVIRHTILFAPLILSGAPQEVFFWLGVWTNSAGNLAHANLDLRFPRWFHYVFVTPDVHHRHHALDLDLGNSNFANSLTLPDILGGTFRHPDEHILRETGIVDDFYPRGFFGQLLAPVRPKRA